VVQHPQVIVDWFEIVAELGRGTTGAVYEARDLKFNRRVALKLPMFSSEAERPTKLQRFERECRVLAYLTADAGSNIPALLMVAEQEGQPFSVREFVEGGTLDQRAAKGRIDLRAGLKILAGVARIVHWVHGRGFAHRNLSPENVLVATDGAPKLIGFGRAGLLAGSDLLPAGNPGASPEIDVRALQDLLGWLCAILGQSVPSELNAVRQPGSVVNPGAFAEALEGYLLHTRG
jgi:serine/threonine protein kinase